MSANDSPNFPGVYITELDAFPTSIVGVATAVPAFIGYTHQATLHGKSVAFQPVAISSLSEFEQVFGAEFNTRYDIAELPGPQFSLTQSDSLHFNLYRSLQLFYSNGGGPCYVVSTGDYSSPVALQPLLKGLQAAEYQVGPTLLAIPDAVLLSAASDFAILTQAMLDQCTSLQDRFAIFDVYGTLAVDQKNIDATLQACVTQFQDAVTSQSPSFGAAYFPFLNATLVSASDVNYTNFNPHQSPPSGSSAPTMLQYVLTTFNTPAQPHIQTTIDSLDLTAPHDDPTVRSNNNLLISALPQYPQLLEQLAAQENVLPPSGAIAGIYAQNDQTRAVWNAPANLSLTPPPSLTVNLDDQQQGGLNVPLNGKAINVIRNFATRGTVIWGARTLDGNSNDYRYIQVRRTLIYIEQSIKNALYQYTFSPNNGLTWSTVVQSISGFLTQLWLQGGLMGNKASDAFTLSCGLGQTMTPTDVLNGYMIVQVTLQMIHPAEFIELTFRQAMQGAD